jgi:activating signal cointegrator complex subunit 2
VGIQSYYSTPHSDAAFRNNADGLLRDRAHLDAIKADILRRVQDMSDDEEDEAAAEGGKIVAFEEELEDGLEPSSAVRVTQDGEESEPGEEDGTPQAAKKVDLETLLEQTYIRDPKLFERDAATRRTKQRADLRAQTGRSRSLGSGCCVLMSLAGWSDEQLEGWRIMLERNVGLSIFRSNIA